MRTKLLNQSGEHETVQNVLVTEPEGPIPTAEKQPYKMMPFVGATQYFWQYCILKYKVVDKQTNLNVEL